MKGVKYEILDYQQSTTRRGASICQFLVQNEIRRAMTLTRWQDLKIGWFRYVTGWNLVIRLKVRVLQFEYLMKFGTLSL